LGIYPNPYAFFEPFTFLPDVCPEEYQRNILTLRSAKEAYLAEQQRLLAIVHGPPRSDIARNEITYWQNVKVEEAQVMVKLRRRAAKAERAFTKKVENIVRQEFGFHKVGEGWVSETMLFNVVSKLFSSYEVVHHARPEWLEGLELDIYVPALKLAFEYQGQQHFHPIEAWGGQGALQEARRRDERKARLCERQGITLIPIDYTEPITEDRVLQDLPPALASCTKKLS